MTWTAEEQTGNSLVVELLAEKGVRKLCTSGVGAAMSLLRRRSGAFSHSSVTSLSPEVSPTSSAESPTWKSCLKKSSWERDEGELFAVLV